jgi:nitronate monooxygenase
MSFDAANRDRWQALLQGLRLPVVVAPMFLVSGPELVLAACRNGLIGSFPAPNARGLSDLDAWMSAITTELNQASRAAEPEAWVAPWAQNLVVHSSYPRLADELKLVREYQPPIVITALGSPRGVVDVVRDYGGMVFADVNSVAFARKALAAGADGLTLVAAGAGGHTGHMAGFALVTAVREFFDGPLILAGAISNGRAIKAAQVLGADLAYMGTAFIAAAESRARAAYKDMVVAARFEDLVLSSAFTGAQAYYLRASIEQEGLDPDHLPDRDTMDLSGGEQQIKAWKDIWSAGQGVGSVHAIEPLADIVARLESEYHQAGGVS